MLHDTLPYHEQCLSLVERLKDEDSELWISRQIVREYLVRATHINTFNVALTLPQVMTQIGTINSLFRIADETEAVSRQLVELLLTVPTSGKQIHDANIVATILVYGIDTLLTLNVEDMKRFGDRITILSPALDT